MPDLTADQLREHAAEIMLDHARCVEWVDVRKQLAEYGIDPDSCPGDITAIMDLIATADITIGWPDDVEPAPVLGSTQHAQEPAERDVLDNARPWVNPCGRHDYGEDWAGCSCPDGDPRPVMARLAAEIERLRNAQGWDPSSPQWAVIRAAIAWRKAAADGDDPALWADGSDLALIEAVDALPDAGESIETPEQSAAIVDANLRSMGARGLAGESQASEPADAPEADRG